jgi:hypothetical protein
MMLELRMSHVDVRIFGLDELSQVSLQWFTLQHQRLREFLTNCATKFWKSM